MWSLIAAVMGLALFSILSLTHIENKMDTIKHATLNSVESQAAIQMNSFSVAAYEYDTAKSLPSGSLISVSQLISAGYLLSSFPLNSPFGQPLQGLTGKNGTLVTYYVYDQSTYPMNFYGIPVNSDTANAIFMSVAKKLSTMQGSSPTYVSAVASNGGGNAYNEALMPYSQTAISMNANDPQFNFSFPSTINLVNIFTPNQLSFGSASSSSSVSNSGSSIASLLPGQSYTDSAGNTFTAYNSSQGVVIYVPVPDGYLWFPQSVFKENPPSLSNFYVPSGTGTNDQGEGPYSLQYQSNGTVNGYWDGELQGNFPISDF